jgi:hypothetical protein
MEVQQLKDDHQAKVLKPIQLVILMGTLRGFGYVFDVAIANVLRLDLS